MIASHVNKKLVFPALASVARLGVVPQSEMAVVRARAWAARSVPGQGVYERQPIRVSLPQRCFPPSRSPSLPLSLKQINKIL